MPASSPSSPPLGEGPQTLVDAYNKLSIAYDNLLVENNQLRKENKKLRKQNKKLRKENNQLREDYNRDLDGKTGDPEELLSANQRLMSAVESYSEGNRFAQSYLDALDKQKLSRL
ncbi:hypothetical protein ACHAP8_012556 [Fusarium lateritium]